MLALEAVQVDQALWLNRVPRLADATGARSVCREGDDRKHGPRSSSRLPLIFRIASIFYLAVIPVWFSPARSSNSDVIPRCLQQAGRNDGFYRRQKWMEAQRAAIECSDALKGVVGKRSWSAIEGLVR
jgi:hypothetical protein